MIVRKASRGTSSRTTSKDLRGDVSSGLCKYSLAGVDVSCCHCCARKRITKEIQDVSTKKQTYVTRKCSKNLCSEDRLMDIYISITPQLQNFAGLLTNLHLKNKLVIKRILLSSSQLITSVKVLLTTTKDNCTKTSFFLL